MNVGEYDMFLARFFETGTKGLMSGLGLTVTEKGEGELSLVTFFRRYDPQKSP